VEQKVRLMKHKILSWLKAKLHLVASQKGSRHKIALGVAIGLFWGFTPLFGLKTVFSLLTAWIVRANKMAAFVAVSIHEVLFPIYPLFYMAGYHLGNWMLRVHGQAHPKLFKQLRVPVAEAPDDWWEDIGATVNYITEVIHTFFQHLVLLLKSLYPLLIGTALLAIPLCIAAYFATLRLLDWYERRQAEKHGHDAHPSTFDVTGRDH